MRTIGVELIGTGYMGKCHALAWTGVHAVFDDTPIVRRVMLCEVEEGLARRRADEFGFESSTDDWRALIADPSVEVVSITTPNALHAPMAIAALEAGKHVWCEKPMAPSLANSERMAAAARASSRVAILGYNYVQSPAVRFVDKLIKSDAIGYLTHFRLEMDEDFMADSEAPFSWRSQASSGYGALDDFAVHPMSLITTLIGAPDQVFGELNKPYPNRPDGGGRREVEHPTSRPRCSGWPTARRERSRSAPLRAAADLDRSRRAVGHPEQRGRDVGRLDLSAPAAVRAVRVRLVHLAEDLVGSADQGRDQAHRVDGEIV